MGTRGENTQATLGGPSPTGLDGLAQTGQIIAGYRIEARAGAGGMGVVFRAAEAGLGRRVALKLILPERARDDRFRRLFSEESRRAAALEHPNVIPIYRSGEEEGVLYIAMRFVDGPNLGQLVARRGRLPVGAAVRIVSQIADALDAAHAAGLVHRDVKPANILLADTAGEEHAYLTDFGLAVPVADGGAQRGRYAGTLSYISPEQIRGLPLDGRADVYALGGVLFHALTGRVPFPASGREAKLVAHLTEAPPRPTELVPGLPRALDDVVAKAMAKRPEDRYPSAGALAAAAREARSDVVVCHHPDDAAAARSVADRLGAHGLEVRDGTADDDLADDLRSARACLVLVGRAGLGAWARPVLAAVAEVAALDRRFSVTTVLLPGGPEPFDPELSFLAGRSFVDLRADLDDPHATGDLLRALGAAPASGVASPTVGDCPYRGLEAFREQDAPLFHGRRRETTLLLQKLRAGRFIAVLGASGSGKSSLVRAGLVPALHEQDPQITVALVTPGASPLVTLCARLRSMIGVAAPTASELLDEPRALDAAAERLAGAPGSAGRLLVVVDQFEEAFSLTAGARERRAFVDALVYAATIPGGRVSVVLCMRSDFYDRCAEHPELRALVAEHQLLVGPLGSEGLRAAIEEPARTAGLELEPGLVRRIMSDVADEPGSLPLMEHLLLELWRRRRGRLMTLEAYAASGGVAGALATRANTVYGGLDPEGQAIARRILLRLTQPGEGTEDTRRRAALSELSLSPDEAPDVERVVETMAVARLLTRSVDEATGEPTVEVAHEALIRGWPELRRWIDRDREALRLHRRLTEAAVDWEAGDRDDGALYRGARLAAWAERDTVDLNPLEREFLEASRDRAQAERSARRRRTRLALAGLAAAVVVVSAVAVVALIQWRDASHAREVALSRQLAGSSTLELGRDPELALLLASEGEGVDPTVQAEEALRAAAYDSKVRAALRVPDAILTEADPAAGGQVVVAAEDGTVRSWDPVTDPRGSSADVVGQWKGGISSVVEGAAGPVSVGPDGAVVLWPADGSPREIAKQAQPMNDVSASADGRRLLTAGDGGLGLWDARTGSGRVIQPGAFYDAAFIPGVGYAMLYQDGRLALLRGGQAPEPVALAGAGQALAVSSDGRLLAVGADNGLTVFRLGGGAPAQVFTRNVDAGVNTVAFSPGNGQLAVGGGDGSVQVLAAESGRALARLAGHDGPVRSVAFQGRERLVTSATDGTARVWAWSHGLPPTLAGTALPNRGGATFAPDGTVTVVAEDGAASVWRPGAAPRPLLPAAGGPVVAAGVTPDRTVVATAAEDGGLLVRDGDGGEIGTWQLGGYASDLAIDARGDTVAAALDEGPVVVVRAGKPDVTTAFRDASASIAVAVSPDGGQVVGGGREGVIRLWSEGAPVRELGSMDGPVFALAFSPDGEYVAAAGADKTVRVFPVSGDGGPWILRGHADAVPAVAFTQDGERLVSGGLDGLRVWDWRRGVTLLSRDAPQGAIALASLGPDPRIVHYGFDHVVTVTDCDVCGPVTEVEALTSERTTRSLTSEERSDFQVDGS